MTFFESIKNKSKKSSIPFDHWEYNDPLSAGAIEEIVNADIADINEHNLEYDGTRAIDGVLLNLERASHQEEKP